MVVTRLTRNQLAGQTARGFESLHLRHESPVNKRVCWTFFIFTKQVVRGCIHDLHLHLCDVFKGFSLFFSEEGLKFCCSNYDFFVLTPNKPLLNLENPEKCVILYDVKLYFCENGGFHHG